VERSFGNQSKTTKEGIALVVPEKRKGVIFCSYKGKWKEELEKRLQTSEKVTLLAIGRIRYKLLAYLRKREDMEIVGLETRYMKNRNKGIGLKVTVRKLHV
jgi:hypothetical protein